ncbi:MAG: zinc ABC transporter substrate-binding protein, partial [Pseudomonadota bacterium]
MLQRRTLLTLGTTALSLSLVLPTGLRAEEKVPVVATFSILGDMVERIGGDHIAVTTLVGPDGDAHVYQPTPADARSVSEAEILFVNGLEFEGWIDRLVDASGFDGTRMVATTGVEAIPFEEDDHHGEEKHGDHDDHAGHGHDDHAEEAAHDDHGHDDHGHDDHGHDDHGHDDDHAGHDDHAGEKHGDAHDHDHGAFDPHAWQSLANGEIYATNIAATLAKADPANAADYLANAAAYIAEMKALDAEIRTLIDTLPLEARTIVTSHDAFGYF